MTLLPYDSIYGEIQKLEHLSLLLEKAKVNYRLVSALSPTVRVIDQMNPCVMRKVVKNPVEIENVRRVHLRDGLAVTRFMHWLKCSVGEIPLSELSVAQKLEEFRKEQDGYIEPSFVTIAAYGDDAAMCHYRANEEPVSYTHLDVYKRQGHDRGGQHVVGDAVCNLSDHIGGGRGD